MKAIIACGGLATRLYPFSKTVPKGLTPILNKPIVDYIIDNCIEAGVDEIGIIVNNGHDLIRKYYTEDKELHKFLEKMHKEDKYEQIKNLHNKAKFTFIPQDSNNKYGSAIALSSARNYVKAESHFIFLTEDDLICKNGVVSMIKEIVDYQKNNSLDGVITCKNIDPSEINRYGMVDYIEENGLKKVTKLIEKPDVGSIKSTTANVSKYILDNDIWKYIDELKPDSKTGEYYVTDAISMWLQKKRVGVYVSDGEYLDIGNVKAYYKTILYFAQNNPELKEILK